MDIVLTIDGGRFDELRRIETAIRDELQERDLRVGRAAAEVEPGALGALEVLQFVGENVFLPMLVQTVYDYVVKRLREPDGETVKVLLTRTDLPGGARRCELAIEGNAKEVAAALEELR
jgi:hypothetical protein